MSEKITDIFVENEIIANENREIYRFGIQQGIMLFFNFLTIIIVGSLHRMIIDVWIYILAYVPLRSYAGGFHANTHKMCYFVSVIILNTVLLIMKCSLISMPSYYCCAFISILLIFFLAPVEDDNKRLANMEIIHYRKKSRIILLLEVTIVLIALLIKCNEFVRPIILALTTLSLLLLIGKLKNSIISI